MADGALLRSSLDPVNRALGCPHGAVRWLLWGLVVEGRRPPSEGQVVLHDGESVAELTSGNFSPSLGYEIAMAFLPLGLVPGGVVVLDQRGTEVAAPAVAPPFVGG